MKKNNKYLKFIIVISLFFLVIACVSSISASDVSNNSVSSNSEISDISSSNITSNNQYSTESLDLSSKSISDDSSLNTVENSKDSNKLLGDVSSGKVKTNASDTEYNDIKSALDDNKDQNLTVYIGEGVYSNSKSGDNVLVSGQQNTKLVLSKVNVTFIGAGSDKTFIDGTNTDWLFNLTSCNVTFMNLSLINAYGNYSSVIKSSYSYVNIINCVIKDNYVNGVSYNSYSPIYFTGGYYGLETLNIINSSFINNTYYAKNVTSSYGFTYSSAASGGALSIASARSNIINSSFINNSAISESSAAYGGAIYLSMNNKLVSFDNCLFDNNYAKNGGSIGSYYGGNFSVLNSNFTNSKAIINGSAIYSSESLTSSSKVYVYVGNNKYENCVSGNGSTDDTIYISGSQLVDLDGNAFMNASNVEMSVGQDKDYVVTLTDKSGNPISGEKIAISMVSSNLNNYFKLVTDENGKVFLNLKDLPLGIYNVTTVLKSDTYRTADLKNTIRIRGNYSYYFIMDPEEVNLTEGEPCTVIGTVVDSYGEVDTGLSGCQVTITYVTIDGSTRMVSGGNIISGSTCKFELSDFDLLPGKTYDIVFAPQDTYSTIQSGHCYVTIVETLPDNYSDIDVIYVDAVNGDDKLGNGTEENPLKSLQVALNLNDALGGNKKIVLKEGNYPLSAYTVKNNVSIVGVNPSKVVVTQISGKKGIFFINGNLSVLFDNITFTNGNTTLIPYGAVFSNYYNSNVTINNSIFYGNKGWYGGVLYNNGDGTVIINNSLFYNNCAVSAGAITGYAGKIYIYNSNFTNNTAQYYFESTDKYVNGSGGAIKLYGSVGAIIENCTFTNNSAPEETSLDGGGAISIQSSSPIQINYCNFINNYAGKYGGAIWAYSNNITIFGSVFINNTAKYAGSVLASYYNDGTVVNITNSVIYSNSGSSPIYVPVDSNTVIYADNNWWGTNSFPSSNAIINNRIIMQLYNDLDGNIYATLNTLKDINGTTSAFEGYLPLRYVQWSPSENFTNPVTELVNGVSVVKYNGDIENDVITSTIDGQKLTLKYTAIKLDTVYVSTKGDDNNIGDIDTPVATISRALHLAEYYNASKIVINEGLYNEFNLIINRSITINGIGTVVVYAKQSGRIFNISTKNIEVAISGITFVNGSEVTGGAILINGSKVNIENCTFLNNTGSSEAGAIYWSGDNGTLVNSVFKGNIARNGGAVSWGGLFDYSKGGRNGQIINCTFDDNYSIDFGGSSAVTAYAPSISIINSNFTNNHGGNWTDHGALMVYGSNSIVSSCLFENNTIDCKGAAIHLGGDNVKIVNNTFINNTMSGIGYMGDGGAIEIQGDNAYISNNTFIGNGGKYCVMGGAIDVLPSYGESATIVNNTFINNTASYGAALYLAQIEGDNSILVADNKFIGNYAKSGSAIYIESVSNATIVNNYFEDVTAAKNQGVVIYNEYGTVTLSNNAMINCANSSASSIHNDYGIIDGVFVTFNNNETSNLLKGETFGIVAKLTDDMGNSISGGKLSIKVNNTVISNEELVGPEFIVNYTPKDSGIYLISGDYDSSDKVNVKTGVLNVLKGTSISYDIDDDCNVIVKLVDEDSNPISNANIIYSINGTEVGTIVTDDNGIANISGLDGKFNLDLRFEGDDNFAPSNASGMLFIKRVSERLNTTITCKDMNQTAVDFYNGEREDYFNVTLRDSNGKALANKPVSIGFNGVVYNLTTDANGVARLQINLAYSGIYTFAVAFLGDDNYTGSFVVSKITITQKATVLTVPSTITYKLAAQTKSITVTLKGVQATNKLKYVNAVNKVITVVVNGKTYTARTNSKGQAVIKVSVNKRGTYTVTTRFAGNPTFAAKTTTSKLVIV
ncbi:hypothetical protein BGI41_06270 [Methanobrevibacter sp. 87.7]|uniref:right-handed parallel beta-helix repeat-containing protein n=1 Tax=Methanobrevibacter sp. 87.7 TaxID=387957 RepID=UPI000B511D11|nr:right-handed parallel beta-helix repeat-containing protein [Methanobrevibacter sp. 87.7]OWT32709.1 hypothetical protein BGI41_06270 [Methanobrevibacter sp. 87.7]